MSIDRHLGLGMDEYNKIITPDNELIAIHRKGIIPWDKFNDQISKELGTGHWWRATISKAEFETYKAFGIKEIKWEDVQPNSP